RWYQLQERSDAGWYRGTGCQSRQSLPAERSRPIPCHRSELQSRVSEGVERGDNRDDQNRWQRLERERSGRLPERVDGCTRFVPARRQKRREFSEAEIQSHAIRVEHRWPDRKGQDPLLRLVRGQYPESSESSEHP